MKRPSVISEATLCGLTQRQLEFLRDKRRETEIFEHVTAKYVPILMKVVNTLI